MATDKDINKDGYVHGHHLTGDFAETESKGKVGLIMGSRSDWPCMKHCADMLEELQIPFEYGVVSAHRTPVRMHQYADKAFWRGLQVIIACAGGSAALPGDTASGTLLPVIGVAPSKPPQGIDAMWSMVRMPTGKPLLFAGFAEAGAKNAALAAARILAPSDTMITTSLKIFDDKLRDEVPFTCHD